MRSVALTFIFICQLLQAHSIYIPLREYSGKSFFDRWDFYGNVDNTTWGTFVSDLKYIYIQLDGHKYAGNASFVDSQTARNKNLVYTNSNGNAIIKVDDQATVPLSPLVLRDTVR